MNVFIVEDQPWFRAQLEEMVASVPGTNLVGCADTAQGAIAAIGACRPDLVLLDLKLAEGTGFEVLRALRERSPTIRVLVLTSIPTAGVKKVCLMNGADGFFDKLLEFDQVRDTLARFTKTTN